MIHRYYKEGQKLDVAGLNEITVLIDRSETELTEIGWNCWHPHKDSPPHKHIDKDQLFYVTDGHGRIKLGAQEFNAQPGCLAYVPAGLVHQSITTGDEPLCYILFNVFNNPAKEGHVSFADHIEKVKHIRKQQAESGRADVVEEKSLIEIKPALFFNDVFSGKKFDFGQHSTILLVGRKNANRCEMTLESLPAGERRVMMNHPNKEQTYFVINGNGSVDMAGERQSIKEGDLVFIPRNTTHTLETTEHDLRFLCLHAFVEV
jgi:mannose-6-phosphate isomerase-like protein (cupin superfamily)